MGHCERIRGRGRPELKKQRFLDRKGHAHLKYQRKPSVAAVISEGWRKYCHPESFY